MGRTITMDLLELDDGHEDPAAAESESEMSETPSNLQRETSALSENIIRIISSGNWESLLPNSGSSVDVGGHQVCVSYDVESSAEYRTWEWQGHILLYDYQDGMYVPEYVYGNYFEPLLKTDSLYENFLDRPPYGLTGIISNIERGLYRTT